MRTRSIFFNRDALIEVAFTVGLIAFMFLILGGVGGTTANERATARKLAPKYQATAEVALDDGTVCDLMNEEYAIEVDYAQKWAESIGQSLHYAEMSGRKPAIIWLVRDPKKDWRCLVRGAHLCGKLNIRLWVEYIGPDGGKPPVKLDIKTGGSK